MENKGSYTEKQKSYIYKYREANKDKINESLRKRYENDENFRENCKERNRIYYQQNKEKILNNEERKARMREYAKRRYWEKKAQQEAVIEQAQEARNFIEE